MDKMVKCKTCKKEIAKSAKACPHCGAKQKKHVALGVVLLIVGIILLVAAFGGNGEEPHAANNTQKPLQDQQEPSPETTKEPAKSVFGVGERVELNDIIVTLVSVKESQGANYMTPSDGKVFLICEFEIENNSSLDIAASSIMSFEAYVDDYSTSMNLSATVSSDRPQLDGSVAAGKKMNGTIGYEVDENWSTLEIRFTPNFWSEKEIVFQHKK